MKPPARLSDHSTCRTRATCAATVRPSTSKRIVSPTWILKRALMLSSIDTSPPLGGGAVGPRRAVDDALVGLEVAAIGDGVFARQRAAAAHVLVVLERHSWPARRRRARAAPAHARRRRTRRPRAPPARRSRRRPDRAGCRAGTCRARRRPGRPTNSRTRFSCSARTPMMKKLPSPTASSTMRIWLPGRLNCSTACRSANQRDRASGRTAAMSATPAR